MTEKLHRLRLLITHLVQDEAYSALSGLNEQERSCLQAAAGALREFAAQRPHELERALRELPLDRIEGKVLEMMATSQLTQAVHRVARLFLGSPPEDDLEASLRAAYAYVSEWSDARDRWEELSHSSRAFAHRALQLVEEGHFTSAVDLADRCQRPADRALVYVSVITEQLVLGQEQRALQHARALLPDALEGLQAVIAYRLGKGDLDGVRGLLDELGSGPERDASLVELSEAYVARGASLSAGRAYRQIESPLTAHRGLRGTMQPFLSSGQPMSAASFVRALPPGSLQRRAALLLAIELFLSDAIDEAQEVAREWLNDDAVKLTTYVKSSAQHLWIERGDPAAARRLMSNLDAYEADRVRLALIEALTRLGRSHDALELRKEIRTPLLRAQARRISQAPLR